ncbi:MAG: NADP-reducing hydrogenase subunit HndA [candidate division BRC1 bacterium ADurb.BinA364]|nr:MAG: NADP-reducing hydrogenase subunit HndA [candidate division BRC1 bacterium ADurb.BinA364]
MQLDYQKPLPPSEDKRWRIVNAAMRRHGQESSALIEALHAVQESFGYLGPEALLYVAECLRAPLSQVYGVATFYHFFNLAPPGEHTCVVCTGTACYIKGVPALLETFESRLGLRPGETTEDNKISLLTARCVGSCSQAPVVVFDNEVVGNATPDIVVARLRRWGV